MFEHLNDILFHKQGDKLDNVDHESEYNMYMINRWISMYSDETCEIVNSTVNWLHPVFETKTDHYKFMQQILPVYRKRFIQYIKRPKKDDEPNEDEQNVELLSNGLELSKREVKYLLEQQHERQH